LCGKSESCLALVDSASALTERGTVISMRSYLYAYATTTPLEAIPVSILILPTTLIEEQEQEQDG